MQEAAFISLNRGHMENNPSELHSSLHFHCVRLVEPPRTLRMRRMAATPELAMTLALLGTRLRRMGMVASAAWSKRLPSTDDRWLRGRADTVLLDRSNSEQRNGREIKLRVLRPADRLTPEINRPLSPPESGGPSRTVSTPPP